MRLAKLLGKSAEDIGKWPRLHGNSKYEKELWNRMWFEFLLKKGPEYFTGRNSRSKHGKRKVMWPRVKRFLSRKGRF